MRPIMKAAALLALGGAMLAVPVLDGSMSSALADGTNVFTQLQSKSSDLFYNARTIILIISALAIVGTMATAITGRFPITKAFAIVGAIVVIGLASEIVNYFAGSISTNTTSQNSLSALPTDSAAQSSGN